MDIKQIRRANLRELVDRYETVEQFCEAADTSASYISQIFSEKTKADVGDKLARKVEKRLGLPHGYMDSLHEEARQPVPPADASPGVYSKMSDLDADSYIWVEHSDVKLSGGNGHGANAEWSIRKGDPVCFRVGWWKKENLFPESCKLMYVRGKSMEKALDDGDSVLVNLLETDPVDGEIYAFAFKNRLYIKTFAQTATGVLLKSENHPAFDHIEIPESELHHLTVLGRKRWRGG